MASSSHCHLYSTGLRHLLWDRNPEMLDNKQVEQSSYILIGASVLLSAGAAVI